MCIYLYMYIIAYVCKIVYYVYKKWYVYMCIYDIQKILLDMTKQQLDDITGVTDNCGKTLNSTGFKASCHLLFDVHVEGIHQFQTVLEHRELSVAFGFVFGTHFQSYKWGFEELTKLSRRLLACGFDFFLNVVPSLISYFQDVFCACSTSACRIDWGPLPTLARTWAKCFAVGPRDELCLQGPQVFNVFKSFGFMIQQSLKVLRCLMYMCLHCVGPHAGKSPWCATTCVFMWSQWQASNFPQGFYTISGSWSHQGALDWPLSKEEQLDCMGPA